MKVNKKVIFLMDLPAPVHGMSNVNQAFFRAAEVQKIPVSVVNTVPSYAANLFGSRLWVWVKIVHTLVCWVRLLYQLSVVPVSAVYRPINGGFGQIYDLVYLAICRMFGKKIYIHHHSFNYLNSESRLFRLLKYVTGDKARHIVLGPRMGDILILLYGISPDRILVLSNVAFFSNTKASTVRYDKENEIVIGHLANLCLDKGVGDFITLCRHLSKNKIKFQAKIAGPFSDAKSEILVASACDELSEMEYLGGVYGVEKDRFFQSLDVFVFPSKYKNEAEPLVLYEAGQYGSLNIGTRRGCMKSVIENLQGESLDENCHIASKMADIIEHSIKSGALSVESRRTRFEAFISLQEHSAVVLDVLLNEMGDCSVSTT